MKKIIYYKRSLIYWIVKKELFSHSLSSILFNHRVKRVVFERRKVTNKNNLKSVTFVTFCLYLIDSLYYVLLSDCHFFTYIPGSYLLIERKLYLCNSF